MGDSVQTFYELYGEAAGKALQARHSEFKGLQHASPEAAAIEYNRAVPKQARHALGEFFTPPWLADLVLDRLDYRGQADLLDPSAGLGVFVDRARSRGGQAFGYEINPVTSACARAMGLPVETRDTLCDPGERRFSFIAGNPPWVNWRNIHSHYRERIKPLWERYDLLPKGRLGGAMDDLSMLFTYLCADRLLAGGGKLGLLLPRTLFQSAGGGRQFRRFELPGGRFIRVLSVEEIAGVSAFAEANTQAVLGIFESGPHRTIYPVAYFRGAERWTAEPVSQDPASAWAIRRNSSSPMTRMRGRSEYAARVGVHSGGASGVYWVDVLERNGATVVIRNRADSGKNKWATVTAEVESDLVRPLIRGRDVKRWHAVSTHAVIAPHSEDGRPITHDSMATQYPLAYAYFEHFREPMLERPHYLQHFAPRRWPYWSMYNVGPYTFATHRVVWKEQSLKFECALMPDERSIPDAKLTLVACRSADEARYLAVALNSPPAREFIESYAVRTQISTHVLRNLCVPQFDPQNELHCELARHYGATDDNLERLARQLWGEHPSAPPEITQPEHEWVHSHEVPSVPREDPL